MAKIGVTAKLDLQARIKESVKTPVAFRVSVRKGRGTGTPVEGLTADHFAVTVVTAPTIGGEAGQITIGIASVTPALIAPRPGDYRVSIQPTGGYAWEAGSYEVDLAVDRKTFPGGGGIIGTLVLESGQTRVPFVVHSS